MQILKRSLLASLILAMFVAAPVWAQETGSITGTAVDPDGAPLPGVAVTLSGRLVPTSTVYTQSNGVYRFPVLPPGADYSLTFGLEGFKMIDPACGSVIENLPLRLSESAGVQHLEPGSRRPVISPNPAKCINREHITVERHVRFRNLTRAAVAKMDAFVIARRL